MPLTFRLLTIIIFFLLSLSCNKEKESPQLFHPIYAQKGENPGIYDKEGRYRIFRGVNYNVLGDYWQANPTLPPTKDYSPDDIRLIASYGFNCIRLLFSWSLLEPQKGVYNDAYIRQIREVIEEAAKYDIYVMLDMHQDAWGKYIATPPDTVCQYPSKGWDGAPLWATITEGQTTCSPDGRRESAPAVYYSFQNFWDNTNGINSACIKAWRELVSKTAQYENLLGYDLLNEPSLGYKEAQEVETAKMEAYYRDLIAAIRQEENTVGARHIVFFEPAIQWRGTETLGLVKNTFTDDQNIVFAPHSYFEAIGNTPYTIEQGLNILSIGSSVVYNTGLFVGEWGFFGNPATDVEKVKRFAAKEDELFASSAWWQWCQAPGDPHGISWDGLNYGTTSLHLIELDPTPAFTGVRNEYYLKVLARTRPDAIPGVPVSLMTNPDTGLMELKANVSKESTAELWIPAFFGEPVITGTNATLEDLLTFEGGYKAFLKVKDSYVINVSF